MSWVLVQLGGLDQTDSEATLRALRQDLAPEPTVAKVTLRSEDPPDGAKSAASLASELAIETIAGTAAGAVVGWIGAWLSQRRKQCSVTYLLPNGVSISLPGLSLEEIQDELTPEVRTLLGMSPSTLEADRRPSEPTNED